MIRHPAPKEQPLWFGDLLVLPRSSGWRTAASASADNATLTRPADEDATANEPAPRVPKRRSESCLVLWAPDEELHLCLARLLPRRRWTAEWTPLLRQGRNGEIGVDSAPPRGRQVMNGGAGILLGKDAARRAGSPTEAPLPLPFPVSPMEPAGRGAGKGAADIPTPSKCGVPVAQQFEAHCARKASHSQQLCKPTVPSLALFNLVWRANAHVDPHTCSLPTIAGRGAERSVGMET